MKEAADTGQDDCEHRAHCAHLPLPLFCLICSDASFSGCACMTGRNPNPTCGPCAGTEGGSGCGPSNHYHARKKWVRSTSTVQKVLDDMKKKYQASIDQGVQADSKYTQSEKDLMSLEGALDAAVKGIEKKCMELKTICSGTNLVGEYVSLIGTLEHEAKLLTDLKVSRRGMREGLSLHECRLQCA